MPVTEEQFQAFLHCETKAYLKSTGTVTAQHEFTDWRRRTEEEFKQKCLSQLRAEVWDEGCFAGTPSPNELKSKKYHLVIDCVLQAQEFQARTYVLERVDAAEKIKLSHHIPIRFIPTEKITSFDKLLLAYDGLALSAACGEKPPFGKIIHGSNQSVTKVKLPDLMDKAKAILGKMLAKQENAAPPPLILNRHCTECECKARCRQIAVEKDELSLLSNLSEKERKQQHSKGIFTVTQLSYTYRPRRRPKRLASKPDNYSHALRALAIRENKIHIAGNPKLTITGTPVYLDVEGVPDRDFYYLIGLRVQEGDSYLQHSFWANDASEEKEIWASFLTALAQIENPQLVHYGSYETTFLKQMKQRYGNVVEGVIDLDQLIKEAVNVLSVIYAQIYFPTYSNSLKDIAPYLGFQWSESDASGLNSLIWRAEWEGSKNVRLKQKLSRYNAEDCRALEELTKTVAQLCQKQIKTREAGAKGEVIHTNSIQRKNAFHLGKNDFSLPELEYINQAAYWHYQRDKVYVKSSHQINRTAHKLGKNKTSPIAVNTLTKCSKPHVCPFCKSPHISKYGKFDKVVKDIKFTKSGIKKWVIKYCYDRYICVQCNFTFLTDERPLAKIGSEVAAFALYLVMELHVSQRAVAKMLNLLFDLRLNLPAIHDQKAKVADTYKETYESLLDKIISGGLIHADETKVNIKGQSAYVWVITCLEEVVYFFTETREGDTILTLLENFKGVLVSDFYAAYDSIECPQQKCLIHLIRDLNDDLLKQPFNEELKGLVKEFAVLLRPMVETVDRFGLKAHFLRKHKVFVERFYKELSKRDYQSEIAIYYRKRFDKNRDKLFTFLDYDGVPWNNNNAEHAIKAFAVLRRVIGGTSTEKGIREYLTLLSICETCKYKGISFLDFLRSGEKDIDTFIKTGKSKAKKTSISK